MTRPRGPKNPFIQSSLSGVRARRSLAFALALFFAACSPSSLLAQAASPRVVFFDLPADIAEVSLRRFAAQSGVEVMFASATAGKVRTARVVGEFTSRAALDRLLAGTPLMVTEDTRSGTLVITRRDPPATSMQTNRLLSRLAAVFALGGATVATGQTPATSATRSASASVSANGNDQAIVLSAFEVSAESDTGYAASSVMSVTNTNEKLENLPNSISVLTQDFLQDLAINDMFGAVEFAIGAENIYNDQGTIGAPVNTRGGNQISFRGFPSIRQLRDGFPWFVPQDAFNIERIEFARGPGGLAYGDVDPGGIINITTKRANFRRVASAGARVDSYGSRRFTLDVNQPLVKDRLSFRLNAIDSLADTAVQRRYRTLEGIAGAVRFQPFKDRRTILDITYERGNTVAHIGHQELGFQGAAYVRGTGTNALDADPNRPGVQVNGVGMRRTATGNTHTFIDHNGVLYNMTATPTHVFRNTLIVTAAAGATSATDPQNPLLVAVRNVPHSIIPEGEDWGGRNTHDTDYYAYTVELKHAFSRNFSVSLIHNGQVDDTERLQMFSNQQGLGVASRGLFIDVNPSLPNPNGPGVIPNPKFEEFFFTHVPILNLDAHDVKSWRGIAVYDARAPFWDMTQRLVGSMSHRHENYETDFFHYALTQAEAARRGFTGAAATFPNNHVVNVHYMRDGNSDEALAFRPQPGVTQFYRGIPANNQRFDQSLTSASFNAIGSYFKGRLHTTAGVSRDHWRQDKHAGLRADPATGEIFFVDNAGTLLPAGSPVPTYPFKRDWVTNQSYGGVFKLRPWLGLGIGYFESSLFSDSDGVDLTGDPREPRTGEGLDYSLRFNLLDGRFHATLTYFETVSENNAVALTAPVLTELNALLTPAGQPVRLANGGDYRDQTSTGFEVELVGNPTRNLTLRATYSQNEVEYTRFFPLVRPVLAEAREAARAQGVDPDLATEVTRDFLENQEGITGAARRWTANATARYTFIEGRLRGLALGSSARYTRGRDWIGRVVANVEVVPPRRTPDYLLVNPFVSYRRKLGRTSWTFQLNVNNVFDHHSDQGNSYVAARWTDSRQYIFSATTSF